MDPRWGDPLFLQRTLNGYAEGLAALGESLRAAAGPAAPGPEAVLQMLASGYRGLFAPSGFAAAGMTPHAPAADGSAAFLRYQRATSRWSDLTSRIALEAGRRLAQALEQQDAPPITSLRELQALWIDCGEAAYGEAARSDEFAAAQAELLMALVELRAATP